VDLSVKEKHSSCEQCDYMEIGEQQQIMIEETIVCGEKVDK